MQTSVESQFIQVASLENAIEKQLIGSILGQGVFPTGFDPIMTQHMMGCSSFRRDGVNCMPF